MDNEDTPTSGERVRALADFGDREIRDWAESSIARAFVLELEQRAANVAFRACTTGDMHRGGFALGLRAVADAIKNAAAPRTGQVDHTWVES